MHIRVMMAALVSVAGSGWSAPAAASDWGCQVLLCLSNPGGPTQYAACVPPITKLWDVLATGGSFPTCSEGNVAKTRTQGKRGTAAYSVTITYADGSQHRYSLAGITPAQNGAVPSGLAEQP